MDNTTLITINDLKDVTSISDNVDVELLKPFLFTSQEMYIRPVLGDAFMDEIINDVSTGGTSYETLINNYIVYALAYSTWFSAAPFIHMKTSKKGILKQSSDNSENVSLEEFGVYSSRIENLMTFYLKKLENYLNDNKSIYPLYCSSDVVNHTNSSTIFLNFK